MKKLLFYASAVAVLFSSCSQDATEDVAIQSSNKVFTASIEMENEQQTRMTIGEDNKYHWQVNDAIGVASKAESEANILVTNTVNGVMPAFSVSNEDYTRWLDVAEGTTSANPLYVYFPYQPNTEFTANGKVNLTIPAVQRYAENSFYRNTVPAVGFLEAYNGSETNVSLKVPVSLLQVWVAGFGDAKSISLSILDKNGDEYMLSGTSTVDVVPAKKNNAYDYETYSPSFAEPIAKGTQVEEGVVADGLPTVTVEFGKKPADLVYNGALSVHFVIPAGLDLSEATLVFTCGDDTFTTKLPARNPNNPAALMTKPNGRMNLGSVKVQFGLANKYLVSTEEEFLAYAYLSQPDAATSFDKADYDYAANAAGIKIEAIADYAKVAGMEALIIADELDFSAFTKEYVDAEIEALAAENFASAENAFWTNVWNWYKSNNYAIEPLSYNAVHGNVMTTIKNLNVLGSGITAGASLSNLTLENVTVNAGIATDVKDNNGKVTGVNYAVAATEIALIAANNELSSTAYASSEKQMKIENVVIGKGNKVVAANGGDKVTYVGGVYATISSAKNVIASKNIKGIALNILSKKDYAPVVGRLYAKTAANKALTFDFTGCEWDASQTGYFVIGIADHSSIEAKGGVSTTMINAGVVGQTGNDYVFVDGVSYWNGGKLADDGNEKIFSAEELAWALDNSGVDNIVLTNNIDMQCNATTKLVVNNIDHKSANNSSISTPKAKTWTAQNPVYETYEIKNVKANIYTRSEVAAFFGNGTVENITFSNFTIDVPVGQTYTAAAGIVAEGTVKNVTVDGLTLNVAKDTKIATVGGVVAKADSDKVANVTANNIKIDSKATASAGIVAGVVRLYGVKSAIKGINVTGTNSVAAGDAKGMSKDKGKVNTNYAANTTYAYNVPFGVANIDCAITADGSVEHKLTVSDSSYGGTFAGGYWFKDAAKAKKDVTLSANALVVTDYNFVLSSNANAAGSVWNNIGFVAK